MDRKKIEKGKKLKRYSKIYKKSRIKKGLFSILFKYGVIFLVIACTSYLITLLVYSFVNRQHCTFFEIPEHYGELKNQNKGDLNADDKALFVNKKIEAVEMPKNFIFKEWTVDAFLKNAKKFSKNAVIITLKDEEGNVLYDSDVEIAHAWKTVVKNPVNASKLVGKIKKEGLIPIVKINAFLDQKAPSAARDNSFVLKSDEDVLYRFEDVETKKKGFWLNPCSKLTRRYILELVKEVKQLGFSCVLFENMFFPNCEFNFKIQDYEYFNSKNKFNVLKEYISDLKKLNINFMIAYDYDVLEDFDDENSKGNLCFGGNVLNFGANMHVLTLKNSENGKDFLDVIKRNSKNKKSIKFIPKLEINKDLDYLISDLEKNFIDSKIVLNKR